LFATTSFWVQEPKDEQPEQQDVPPPDELRHLPESQLLLRHLPGHQLWRHPLLEHQL